MCGFLGVVASRPLSEQDKLVLKQATKAINHRGPDANGIFVENSVGLGHVRLSILDLTDAGAQPMSSGCGRYVISYNGEVYNFKELAEQFELTNLKSHSDTEVILEAFAKVGEALFSQLNGMFAFALLDRQTQKLWLVRDRLGIKPLYISQVADNIVFGSEIKALQVLQPTLKQVNKSALGEWSYYGTTLGQQTLFNGVTRLLPGHFIRLDTTKLNVTVESYWQPSARPSVVKGDIVKQAHDVLEQAVKRQLVSDVPVGVFLSGGIDSSAITAFASKHYNGKLATYSVGFDYDKGANELPKAKTLAQRYGTEHHEIHISGMDVAETVQRLVTHHDQPFSDAANIPLYMLCQQVKDKTKVVLQGDGGDELFGGYKRYATLSRLSQMKAAAYATKFANAFLPKNAGYYNRQRYSNALLAKPLSKVMALLLTVEDERQDPTQIFQPKVREQFANPFARYEDVAAMFESRSPADQMLLVDSMIILPDVFLEKVDRSTMAASVEVRVPFLDNDVVEFCHQLTAEQKIPKGQQKHLLKQCLAGIVPDNVLYGKKTGFGVPFGYWLKGPLKELFFDNLAQFSSRNPGIIEHSYVLQRYDEHQSGKKDNGFLLWKLLNLLIWSNQYDVDWGLME